MLWQCLKVIYVQSYSFHGTWSLFFFFAYEALVMPLFYPQNLICVMKHFKQVGDISFPLVSFTHM